MQRRQNVERVVNAHRATVVTRTATMYRITETSQQSSSLSCSCSRFWSLSPARLLMIAASGFAVRRATAEDFAAIRDIFYDSEVMINLGKECDNSAWRQCGEDYAAMTFRTDLASFDALCATFFAPRSHFWVAEDTAARCVVGCVALQAKSSDDAELRRMCVSRAHRRRGIGLALVQTLLQFAAANGVKRVFMTTPTVNERAIAMYAKAGLAVEKTIEQPVTLSTGGSFVLELSQMAVAIAP
jgi:ribosomal protein S18 acetylase RimI-like enzyme